MFSSDRDNTCHPRSWGELDVPGGHTGMVGARRRRCDHSIRRGASNLSASSRCQTSRGCRRKLLARESRGSSPRLFSYMTIQIPDHIRSWHLDRLSPNSDVASVVLHVRSFLSDSEISTIRGWLRDGDCYRFRIGNARYFFGKTPQEAIDLAVENHNGCVSTTEGEHGPRPGPTS